MPGAQATAGMPADLVQPDSWFFRLGEEVRSSPSKLAAYLLVGLSLTVLCIAAGSATGRADPTHGCRLPIDGGPAAPPGEAVEAGTWRPPGIVALEFAGTRDAADAILERWGACGSSVEDARRALRLDTALFVPGYVAALMWWCAYWRWAAYRRKVRRLARALLVLTALAGILDLIENAGLALALQQHSHGAVLATTASVPKWLVLIAALPVALTGLAGGLRRLAEMVFRGRNGMQPAFFGPLVPGEPDILSPLGPDRPEAERRRRRSLDPHGQPWPSGTVGICLSGGGIRSASFALGVLQALHVKRPGQEESIYGSADYLATVSGGGYTGTAAQILAHQHPEGDPPLMPGSSEAELLCDGRRYLWGSPKRPWNSTREFVSGVTLFTAGILFNAGIVIACVYSVSHPVGWAWRSVVFAGSDSPVAPARPLTPGLAGGFALASVILVGVLWPILRRRDAPKRRSTRLAIGTLVMALVVGPLVIVIDPFRSVYWAAIPLGAALLRVIIRVIRQGRGSQASTTQAGPSQAGPTQAGPSLRAQLPTYGAVALAWALVGLLVTAAWFWADQAFVRGRAGKVDDQPALVLLGIVAGVQAAIVAGAALRIGLDRMRRAGVSPTRSNVVFGLGVLAAVVCGGGVGWLAFHAAEGDPQRTLGSDFFVWSIVAAGVAIVYLFGDQKRWSPHPLYKARLGRTFALTRFGPLDDNGTQKAARLPARTRTTLSEWAAKPPEAPELLICAAVYDSVERRSDLLRAWPFVFSHRHVGGSDVGWARTVDFEAVLGKKNQSDGTLQAAMAISGAAVSPAIGRISAGSANALIAAANLRLGVWLPSPRTTELQRKPISTVPTWVQIRRITYLLKEICGGYDLGARLVYVTDGGQFDNLGLFELLARRCSTIYCFDASGDLKAGKDLSTKTFDETREYARIRLGVLFSVPRQPADGCAPTDEHPGKPITPKALSGGLVIEDEGHDWRGCKPGVKVATHNVQVLDIHYPEGPPGRLVIGKCLLTADPVDSAAYRYATSAAGRHSFPADSTVDQWLDEEQFHAYVDLGRTVGGRAAVALTT